MIRRSTLIAVEILLGLVAAMAIGVGLAWWRLSQGPVDLSFIRQQVQSVERGALGPAGRAGAGGACLEPARRCRNPRCRRHHRGRSRRRTFSFGRADRTGCAAAPDRPRQLVRADFSGGELTITRQLDEDRACRLRPRRRAAGHYRSPPPIGETWKSGSPACLTAWKRRSACRRWRWFAWPQRPQPISRSLMRAAAGAGPLKGTVSNWNARTHTDVGRRSAPHWRARRVLRPRAFASRRTPVSKAP